MFCITSGTWNNERYIRNSVISGSPSVKGLDRSCRKGAGTHNQRFQVQVPVQAKVFFTILKTSEKWQHIPDSAPTLTILSPMFFLFSRTTGMLSLFSMFHRRMVWSRELERIHFMSLVKSTSVTQSVWPCNSEENSVWILFSKLSDIRLMVALLIIYD